jgi:Lrp/AsnC family transcriptional regulator
MPRSRTTPFPLDDLDRKILSALQEDASLSLEAISRKVGASKTPIWNRIHKMTEAGVIEKRTVLLNPEALGLGTCFFVLVRTADHSADWQARFLQAVRARPEVLEAHRLAGDIDYLLKVRVSDAHAYDDFYQALIAQVRVHEVTALLSMEEIKAHAPLPLHDRTQP